LNLSAEHQEGQLVHVDVAAFDEEDAFMSAQGTDLSDYVVERLDAIEEIEDAD